MSPMPVQDNFEWNFGWNLKFGLYSFDPRLPKEIVLREGAKVRRCFCVLRTIVVVIFAFAGNRGYIQKAACPASESNARQ